LRLKPVLVDLPAKYVHLAPRYWAKAEGYDVWSVLAGGHFAQPQVSLARLRTFAATALLHRIANKWQFDAAMSLVATSLLEKIETDLFEKWAIPNGGG
jgi:hypothetical protein